MIKRLAFCIMLATTLQGVCQDIAPLLKWDVEVTKYKQKDWEVRRGESITFQPTFLQDGLAKNLSAANTVKMLYTPLNPATNASHFTITGSVYNATSGIARVQWTAAAEAVPDYYSYEISISANTQTLVRAFGVLKLEAGVGDTGTATNPTVHSSIDWLTTDQSNVHASGFVTSFDISRIDNLEDDYATTSNDVDVLRADYAATSNAVDVLSVDYAATSNSLDTVSNDLDTLETNYAATSNAVDVLRADYATTSNSLDTVTLNYGTTSNDVDVLRADYATTSNAVDVLSADYAATSNSLDTVSNDLDTLETNYAATSNAVDVLRTDYAATSNSLDTLETNYATTSNAVDELRTDYAATSNIVDNAILKDGSRTWTGNDNHGGYTISNGVLSADMYADCTNIWYVALCGDDANSGLTEISPKLTIQAAIDAASLIEVAGGGHQKIQFGGGDWTEANTLAKGISLYGAGRRATRLGGSLTIATNYTGGEIKDFQFQATGTTGGKYVVPAGLTDLVNIRLEDVGFQFTSLTNFTDTPVKIYSGNNIFNNVGLDAPSPDFTSMADSSGSFLVVTNGADLSMNYFQVIMEDVNITNGTMNILDLQGTGNIRIKNSSMDITLTNSFDGDFRGIYWSAPSGEHQMIGCDLDIEGADDTVGDADGVYVDEGTVRSAFCEINIDGFLENDSYHRLSTTNAEVHLIVNFSSDTTEYDAEGSDTFLNYIGSPQDGLFRTPLFQFGQNGQVYSAFPESPTLTGHNGTSWWNFCESKNAVYGEDAIYNNATIVIDDTEYQAQDSDGFSMGMTLTVDGWDASKGDGENADGTLFPAIVVKSEFETLDDETGTVTLAGCEIGETYVWEILGSAKDASKDCTDMTYWIVGGGTGTVDVVDNTDDLVTITNVATTDTMILYCSSPNAGEDSFLNAIRISGPAGAGLDERYLRLDGQEAMKANGDVGGYKWTNQAPGTTAGDGAIYEQTIAGDPTPQVVGHLDYQSIYYTTNATRLYCDGSYIIKNGADDTEIARFSPTAFWSAKPAEFFSTLKLDDDVTVNTGVSIGIGGGGNITFVNDTVDEVNILTADVTIGTNFFFDISTGKMHLGIDSTFPSVSPMGKTNILFTAGTNTAYIGW